MYFYIISNSTLHVPEVLYRISAAVNHVSRAADRRLSQTKGNLESSGVKRSFLDSNSNYNSQLCSDLSIHFLKTVEIND